MKKFAAACALLFAFTCLAADLDGKWKSTVETGNGPMEITYTFKVEDGKLSGTLSGQMGEFPLSDGKVTGDEIAFNVKTDNFTAVHKGTVAGDEIKLTVEVGDRTVPMVAKRVK
jgi:hypothetical protein